MSDHTGEPDRHDHSSRQVLRSGFVENTVCLNSIEKKRALMQTNHSNTRPEFTAQKNESSFSSVWGNEMQREDFLALASGLRQFSAGQADLAFAPSSAGYATGYAMAHASGSGTEQGQLAGE
jgi:hypothetical protein